jgi:hypothetical protein
MTAVLSIGQGLTIPIKFIESRKKPIHAIRTREHEPLITCQITQSLICSAPICWWQDLDHRHDDDFGAKRLERLRERLGLLSGARDYDAPAFE